MHLGFEDNRETFLVDILLTFHRYDVPKHKNELCDIVIQQGELSIYPVINRQSISLALRKMPKCCEPISKDIKVINYGFLGNLTV